MAPATVIYVHSRLSNKTRRMRSFLSLHVRRRRTKETTEKRDERHGGWELVENFWHNDTDFNLISRAGMESWAEKFSHCSIAPVRLENKLEKHIFRVNKISLNFFPRFAFHVARARIEMKIDSRQLRSIGAADDDEREFFFVYSQQDLRVVGAGWGGRAACLFADDAVFGAKWIFNVMNGSADV